jgi:small nuclear ribonucleoprotein (snRNP)-like protein
MEHFKEVKSSEDASKVIYKRSKPKIPAIMKSLSILLTSLQGVKVMVELKSDIQARGTIEEVDKDMNILLRNVTQSKLQVKGENEEDVVHESYYINGPSIRYVHIPSEINAFSHVGAYMKQIDRIKGRNLPNRIIDRKPVGTKRSIEQIGDSSTSYRQTRLTPQEIYLPYLSENEDE